MPLSAQLQSGLDLHRQGCLDEAQAIYEGILSQDPANVGALRLMGVIALQRGWHSIALAFIDQALSHEPDFVDALLDRARVLRALNQLSDALISIDRALALDPAYTQAWSNRGNVLKDLGRLQEAMASYDRALALDPNQPEASWNKAWALLLTGDLAAGWPLHEVRWQVSGRAPPVHDKPQWRGDTDLGGKTILLQGEQGFGDVLQFCRYAPLVAARGARVILEVDANLRDLMTSLEGVETLITKGEPYPEFDLHCPLLSLPLAFGTTLETIPGQAPYLRAEPARVEAWGARYPRQTGRPRLGLTWSGSFNHLEDERQDPRSLPLADLIAALPADADLFCLNIAFRPADRALLAQRPDIIVPPLKDFADTAALIETLDQVITIDTAVAHLSGALAKPTTLLLHANADWRWLQGRSDSPWYPTVRIYRQDVAGDWSGVLRDLGRETPSDGR